LAREQVEQMGDPESEELDQRVRRRDSDSLREKPTAFGRGVERSWSRSKLLVQGVGKGEGSGQQYGPGSPSHVAKPTVLMGRLITFRFRRDAQSKIIVGVGATQAPADSAELESAVDRVEANMGQRPKRVVVDAGFTNQSYDRGDEPEAGGFDWSFAERSGVALSAGWRQLVGVGPDFYPQAFEYNEALIVIDGPRGKVLVYRTQERQGATLRRAYRARPSDCRVCSVSSSMLPWDNKRRSLVRSEQSPELRGVSTQNGDARSSNHL